MIFTKSFQTALSGPTFIHLPGSQPQASAPVRFECKLRRCSYMRVAETIYSLSNRLYFLFPEFLDQIVSRMYR